MYFYCINSFKKPLLINFIYVAKSHRDRLFSTYQRNLNLEKLKSALTFKNCRCFKNFMSFMCYLKFSTLTIRQAKSAQFKVYY